MNTNNENKPNIDAINRTPNDAINRIATRRDAKHRVSTTASEIFRPIRNGILFALGFFGTTLLGVAISGTIKTWTSGEVLKSADLNTTISSMKTAIESIPNWTKASNGTDAYYTDGKVGIGTASPSYALDVNGPGTVAARIIASNPGSPSPEGFVFMSGNNAITGFQIAHWDSSSAGTAWISFPNTNHTTHTSDLKFSTRNFDPGIIIKNSGSVGIGTISPSQMLTVNGNAGNTTGVWVNNSDERLKKNIQPLGNYLELMTELRPVTFEWKDPKKLNAKEGKHIGFIAQEVEKVFPHWVDTDKEGMKWLSPEGINAAFVQSIKELKSLYDNEKKSAEKKLSLLEESNQKLKTENKKLQELVESHGRASLRLEERLNALEKVQMAAQARK